MDLKGREQLIRPNVSLLSGYGLEAFIKHGQERKPARKRRREKAMGKARKGGSGF